MARNCVQSFNVEMLQSIKDTPQKICHVVLLKLIIIGSEQMYYLQSSSSSLKLQHYITIGIVECKRFNCVAFFSVLEVVCIVKLPVTSINFTPSPSLSIPYASPILLLTLSPKFPLPIFKRDL